MTKKFSELSPITTPANGDLFALTDTSATESKRITFESLKVAMIDESTFNYATVIASLNAHDPSSGGVNGLYATRLNVAGEYYPGSHFLSYANITGKPTLLSNIGATGDAAITKPASTLNLEQFDNTTGFLRFNSDTNDIGWYGSSTVIMSTSNLGEGTNLYYTDARAKANLVANFAEQFNIYNSTFDQGAVRDSVYGLEGTWQDINVSGAQHQSKKFRITGNSASSTRAQFQVGQVLRFYGASTLFSAIAQSATLAVTVQGFTENSSNKKAGTIAATYSYKIAEFDLESGEISPVGAAVTKTIYVPSTGGAANVADQFNTSHFIRCSFTAVPADRGVAVYRRIGTSGDYKLTAVLGRKEVDAGSWIDYQAFDYTSWSGKNSTDNTFTSIVHFPLIASSSSRRGWVDKTITVINQNTNDFDLSVDDWVFVNPSVGGNHTAQVCHNDTSIIQNAITSNSAVGKKSIVLNAKTYNSSLLSIPNNFGLVGTSYITKIKKLPWTGGEASALNGKFIVAQNQTGATSLSIVGVDIDGVAPNQFLWPDSTTVNRNYLLDFGINCNSLLLDRVRITNAPAGGVYATSPVELKINTSEIVDSATTDRYEYSPLVADSGTDTMITGNRFQNYTDYVDVSVTNKGIVANNVVNNCGSGLFVYGSVFFVSSPNVLMGPAQEFLPTPDILNSEYDLINIDLSEARAAGDDYDSPGYVYQEDGADFDLDASAGSIKDITHRAFYLQKTEQGVEEVYGTTTVAGNFQVTSPETRYTILTLGNTTPAQWNTAAGTTGKVYSVGDTFTASAAGTGTGTATSGGVDTIQMIDVAKSVAQRKAGQFAFVIPVATVNAIKNAGNIVAIGSFVIGQSYTISVLGVQTTQAHWNTVAGTSGVTYSVGSNFTAAAVGTVGDGTARDGYLSGIGQHSYSRLKAANPLHEGIGWSSTFRNEVSCGIPEVGADPWAVDATNGTDPIYTVSVENLLYASVGKRVKFSSGHTGWQNPGNITIGTITEIGINGATYSVKIKFKGAGGGTQQANAVSAGLRPGVGGTLNIIDSFVMAQGRII